MGRKHWDAFSFLKTLSLELYFHGPTLAVAVGFYYRYADSMHKIKKIYGRYEDFFCRITFITVESI